jgi:acetyltransferase-like isoleucine patch superfamily enzyme
MKGDVTVSRPRPAPPDETGRVISTDEKPWILGRLNQEKTGAFAKYELFFTGRPGIWSFLRYELATLARPLPGALGYALRARLWPGLLAACGPGVVFGEQVALRHPGKIRIGARSAVDDFVLLCARGAADDRSFVIGEDVLITRHSVLQVKVGSLVIGNHVLIGVGTQMIVGGELRIGDNVMTGPQCFIGGSHHGMARNGVPMIDQATVTRGPTLIGSDVWLGTGVRVLDGVAIGAGAVIGTGAVVTRDVPDYAIAAGVPARVVGERPAAAAGQLAAGSDARPEDL